MGHHVVTRGEKDSWVTLSRRRAATDVECLPSLPIRKYNPCYLEMTKRKQLTLGATPAGSTEHNDDDQTADDLIETQKAQQKKRRTKSAGGAPRAKPSLWTTIAAARVDGDKPRFKCNVCAEPISTNQMFSSSNVVMHYRSRHSTLHQTLSNLNEQNANEDMLLSLIHI